MNASLTHFQFLRGIEGTKREGHLNGLHEIWIYSEKNCGLLGGTLYYHQQSDREGRRKQEMIFQDAQCDPQWCYEEIRRLGDKGTRK